MDESRVPVLIGSGQITQKEPDPALGLSPIDLTAAAEVNGQKFDGIDFYIIIKC